MESAVSEAELSDLLKDPNYTVLLNDQFSKSAGVEEDILEVLGYDSKRVLKGIMIQGQGIVLTTNGNKSFMEVTFTEELQVTLGKIYGPNRTLLHTVEFEEREGDYDYWNIMRDGDQFIKIEVRALTKMMPCLSMLFRCCLCMKGDREITYYTQDGQKQIGRTAPGICRGGSNVILYFQPEATTEERLALLGTSILFVLEVLYPQYGKWARYGETV